MLLARDLKWVQDHIFKNDRQKENSAFGDRAKYFHEWKVIFCFVLFFPHRKMLAKHFCSVNEKTEVIMWTQPHCFFNGLLPRIMELKWFLLVTVQVQPITADLSPECVRSADSRCFSLFIIPASFAGHLTNHFLRQNRTYYTLKVNWESWPGLWNTSSTYTATLSWHDWGYSSGHLGNVSPNTQSCFGSVLVSTNPLRENTRLFSCCKTTCQHNFVQKNVPTFFLFSCPYES